uniref:N-acetylglucosamine-1-phosphodiester alpha-N-acetylglucosaminidase n=1 Tax=Labrus bergylta TaxID=56723 RepID=A0A3Q3FZI1_9LABR
MAEVSVKCPLACLLLLWLCVRLTETKNTRVSMEDDLLLPYAEGHGPAHSHRYVRDCQAVTHGNTTHESWPTRSHGGLPVAESTMFVSSVPQSSRWVYGHMTVVNDPLRTVSVLEPGGPGGCGMNQRATVEETAAAAGCLYAQNGGFFDTKEDKCLGNLVSDGRLVQDSGGIQNAQFGIREDGTLVFGFLSQEEVLDRSNPFVQLISGVVWLLRNGEVYINQSLQAECDKTQETGFFREFVDVVSARTAVGHDAEGRLILFQIDGQTKIRGMSLWEVADTLKQYGIINAINLDGGGSSTYVVNGRLASYPSDHCIPDGRWRCGRRVSTILCVHQRRCKVANCSGHGECVDGRCWCQQGWQGDACDSLVCQQADCEPHGVCTAGGCVCDAGWRGKNCSQAGHCLANQMFSLWRRDEEAHRERPLLTEGTWLILTVSLASLLSLSLTLHLVRACRGSPAARFSAHRDYSLVPLMDINGAAVGGEAGTRKLEELDSQDEVWSPSGSGGS